MSINNFKLFSFLFFSCLTHNNKTCLLNRTYICDNLIQCRNVDFCDVSCVNYYRCRNNTCVPMTSLCNGISTDGCEEDQEWTNGPGFKCLREGSLCFLPQQLLTDQVQDCDNGQDLCYVNNELVNKKQVFFLNAISFNRK